MGKKRRILATVGAVAGIYLCLNVVAVVNGEREYRRLKAGDDSRFQQRYGVMYCGDGGSSAIDGFGYRLVSMHRIHTDEHGNRVGTRIGPSIRYSLWVFMGRNHEDTHIDTTGYENPQQKDALKPE